MGTQFLFFKFFLTNFSPFWNPCGANRLILLKYTKKIPGFFLQMEGKAWDCLLSNTIDQLHHSTLKVLPQQACVGRNPAI